MALCWPLVVPPKPLEPWNLLGEDYPDVVALKPPICMDTPFFPEEPLDIPLKAGGFHSPFASSITIIDLSSLMTLIFSRRLYSR
jgi:hypothetical protein